ncbi:MAG TPA: glutathione S-transferase family protein [Sphingomonadaceae bacterium]
MLELFHWEPNGASLRVLAALDEKRLPYRSHFVDVLARANHEGRVVVLNPTGELPVLVDRDSTLTGASYICEYLEDAFPDTSRLMPGNPAGNWRVRYWQKYVDDYLASAISDLAWDALGDRRLAAQGANSAPTLERQAVWREHAEPFPMDRLAKAREYAQQTVARLEEALRDGPWLSGEMFTLADIAMAAWVAYFPSTLPGMLGPAAQDWLDRVFGRPGFVAALRKGRAADPFTLAAPGPEATRWG